MNEKKRPATKEKEMDHTLVLTPREIVDTVLAICGAIITISAALTVIYKVIMKAKEPDKKQNERISVLEDHVVKIEARLELGNKRFAADAERADAIETGMRDSINVIIETLQALTAHAIDGNNIQELKEAKKQLTEYLLKR